MRHKRPRNPYARSQSTRRHLAFTGHRRRTRRDCPDRNRRTAAATRGGVDDTPTARRPRDDDPPHKELPSRAALLASRAAYPFVSIASVLAGATTTTTMNDDDETARVRAPFVVRRSEFELHQVARDRRHFHLDALAVDLAVKAEDGVVDRLARPLRAPRDDDDDDERTIAKNRQRRRRAPPPTTDAVYDSEGAALCAV